MSEEEQQFLNLVYEFVKVHPEIAPYVVDSCNKGIGNRLREEKEKCSDLEAALVISITTAKTNTLKQLKEHEFIKQKINTWRDRLSLNWDFLYKPEPDKKTKR